jgi:hypothetical protein
MTNDDIIRMAREAGFDPHDMSDDFTCNLMDIERFANLVATEERDKCADELFNDGWGYAAKTIRARGQERQERINEALDELQADGTLSPAEHRRLINRPWHDKASY